MKLKPNLFQRTFKFAFVPSFAIIFIGTAADVRAAIWDGSDSTDWNTAGNWDTNSVPNGQNAVINLNTGNIATISANVTNPQDLIVGNGSGTNGRVNHLAGSLTTNSWFKVGHNGGIGVYNLAGTGTGGTYTGLSQGSGSITVGQYGQLRLGGDGGNNTGNGTLNLNTTGSVNVNGGDIVVGGNGSGTLNMDSGTLNRINGGVFRVGQGSGVTGLMRISGGTVNNTGEFWIGNDSGSNGTVTLSGGNIEQDSWLSIGRNGGTGVLNVSGGTLNKIATNSQFVVGDGTSAGVTSTGTLNQTGGTINVARELWIGQGNGAGSQTTGTATVSDGSLNVNSWLAVGRNGGTGTLTISGTATVNQGITDSGSNLEMTNFGAGGSGTVNLNGGILTVNGVAHAGGGGGTSVFNFNGGTLRARKENSAFMQGLTTSRVRDNGAIIDTQAFSVTIGQSLLRSGSFDDAGTGVMRKIGTGTLTLSGTGDNSGLRARVEAGTLVLGKTSSGSVHAVGTDGGTDYALQITGGTAKLGGTGGDQIYVNSAVSMTGGTFDLAGMSEGFDGLSGSAGTITNSAATTTSTLTLGQNNSSGSPVFGGIIQNGGGTLALTKTGSGTQTLSGANTYTGGTALTGGTLAVRNNGALGTGTLTMGSGTTLANSDTAAHTLANNIAFGSGAGMAATLSANSDLALTGALSGGSSGIQIAVRGPGTVTISNSAHNLGSNAAPAIWTVTDGGTLALTQGNNLGNLPSSPTSQLILDNGTFKTITANSPFFSARGMQVNAAGGTWHDSAGGVSFDGAVANNGAFTINTSVSNATTTLNGAVTGSGSLIKTGGGTLVLNSGASNYAGVTSVTTGKLVVNGNISTSATTTVSGTGTLGGSGTVGSLIVQAGGTLAPGNSPGILNTGSLDLQTGSTLGIEIDGLGAGTNYDQLNVTGSATLAGLLSVSLGFSPTNGDLFFILLNDSDDAVNGTFSGLADSSEFNVGDQDFRISYFGNSATSSFTGGNDVVLMAVPEPGAALLGSLGLLVLLRRRR